MLREWAVGRDADELIWSAAKPRVMTHTQRYRRTIDVYLESSILGRDPVTEVEQSLKPWMFNRGFPG